MECRLVLAANPFQWTDPRSWPWFFYLVLAVIVAGWLKPLWQGFRRSRAASWPITTGQIESATVNETNRRSGPAYLVDLGYSYVLAGRVEAGSYRREFYSEQEALGFVRDLKGRPVTVHYKPNKLSVSLLSEESVDTLLRLRSQVTTPPVEVFSFALKQSAPSLTTSVAWVFVVLSAVGLVVSLWVHLGAVLGRRVAPEAFFWILHMGIFVVWIPAVLVARERVGNLRRKDSWKLVLQDSPEWMRYMVYVFFVYALLNFALFALHAPIGNSSGANPPAIVWRGFSGHWMFFYSTALAILYPAATRDGNARCCLNGHPISPGANFCSRCGQPATQR